MIRIIKHYCVQIGESKWVDRYITHDVTLPPEVEVLLDDSDRGGNLVGIEVIKQNGKPMSAIETKNCTLEILEFLLVHPDIIFKSDLPQSVWEKIKGMQGQCPLCDFFYKFKVGCSLCPLGNCWDGSAYRRWAYISTTDDERKAAAQEAYDKVKAWDV